MKPTPISSIRKRLDPIPGDFWAATGGAGIGAMGAGLDEVGTGEPGAAATLPTGNRMQMAIITSSPLFSPSSNLFALNSELMALLILSLSSLVIDFE